MASNGSGLIGLAARTRQTILTGDVRSDPRYMPDADDNPARIPNCASLVSGTHVLGVLDVESTAWSAFDSE